MLEREGKQVSSDNAVIANHMCSEIRTTGWRKRWKATVMCAVRLTLVILLRATFMYTPTRRVFKEHGHWQVTRMLQEGLHRAPVHVIASQKSLTNLVSAALTLGSVHSSTRRPRVCVSYTPISLHRVYATSST